MQGLMKVLVLSQAINMNLFQVLFYELLHHIESDIGQYRDLSIFTKP